MAEDKLVITGPPPVPNDDLEGHPPIPTEDTAEHQQCDGRTGDGRMPTEALTRSTEGAVLNSLEWSEAERQVGNPPLCKPCKGGTLGAETTEPIEQYFRLVRNFS